MSLIRTYLLRRWRRSALTLLAAVALAMSVAVPAKPAAAEEAAESDADNAAQSLLEVYYLLKDHHYTHPDEELLIQGAIRGMLESINDPYSEYLDPEQYRQLIDAINFQFVGIGVLLAVADDGSGLWIERVFPGTPASEAGLAAGDKIIAIDGEAVRPDNAEQMLDAIPKEDGAEVKLTLLRAGKRMTKTLVTRPFQIPDVLSEDLGDGIAYVSILTFGENTFDEVMTEVLNIQASGAKGLVLDLRGNGGGFMGTALDIADLFLSKGTLVYLHDENGKLEKYTADSFSVDLPMAVLIDGESASAAELLAGTLQKNGRAVLIGERSFGKATMQSLVELSNGGVLRVSVDNWLLPDRSNIHGKGLVPNIRISRPEAAVNAAVQWLLPERRQRLQLSLKDNTGLLNGDIQLYEVPELVREDGTLYFPLRYVIESFGSEVRWDENRKQVQFGLKRRNVEVDPAKGLVWIDGSSTRFPRLIHRNGQVYLPKEALELILGTKIQVNDAEVIVEI